MITCTKDQCHTTFHRRVVDDRKHVFKNNLCFSNAELKILTCNAQRIEGVLTKKEPKGK